MLPQYDKGALKFSSNGPTNTLHDNMLYIQREHRQRSRVFMILSSSKDKSQSYHKEAFPKTIMHLYIITAKANGFSYILAHKDNDLDIFY